MVATIKATEQLTLILNYDWVRQENATSLIDGSTIEAKRTGVAAYVNYQPSDQWRWSLRAEHFDDEDGYRTGVVQEWSRSGRKRR